MANLAHLGGWRKDDKAVEYSMGFLPTPLFRDVWQPTKDTGSGKTVLLYEIIRTVSNNFPIRTQEIGDCVGQAAAYAVDAAKSIDIHIHEDFEEWVAETATEDIYAGSRILIGGGLNGDGSMGVWAARYCNDYGAVPRGKYGEIDLSNYSGGRAKSWGDDGVPASLLHVAKQHPILTVSRVDTYEQARDLLSNGYAVTIASNQGFRSTRDKEGFAKPKGEWAHAMCLLGVDDSPKRPGVLCVNSWGYWNDGPKRLNQPEGSFWIDADVLENNILSAGDSWAYSGYEGFQPRKLNTRII